MNLPATASQLAERGIAESHEHAESVDAGWSERAIVKVAEFARFHPEFLTEEAKKWAYEDGLAEPTDDSAWGHVMRTAAKRAFIHRWGERAASSSGSHGKLMANWRRGPKPEGMVDRAEALAKADEMDRWAVQMKSEGRALFAMGLSDAAKMIRSLVTL